jgi:hypothetical protein
MALPPAPPPLVTVQAHKARGELDSTQWAPGNGVKKMTVKRSISSA